MSGATSNRNRYISRRYFSGGKVLNAETCVEGHFRWLKCESRPQDGRVNITAGDLSIPTSSLSHVNLFGNSPECTWNASTTLNLQLCKLRLKLLTYFAKV